MTIEFILGHLNYWLFIILMMTGFYIVVSRGNYVKKIVGLGDFVVDGIKDEVDALDTVANDSQELLPFLIN